MLYHLYPWKQPTNWLGTIFSGQIGVVPPNMTSFSSWWGGGAYHNTFRSPNKVASCSTLAAPWMISWYQICDLRKWESRVFVDFSTKSLRYLTCILIFSDIFLWLGSCCFSFKTNLWLSVTWDFLSRIPQGFDGALDVASRWEPWHRSLAAEFPGCFQIYPSWKLTVDTWR